MKVLYPASEITQKVKELGEMITAEYQGKDLLVIGILKGGFMFMSDLVRTLNLPVKIEFVRLSSYGCSDSPQWDVKVVDDVDQDTVKGKHVLIVDDIMDTGQSLVSFKRRLEAKGPASIKICTMINKTARRDQAIEPDYYGFKVEDGFIVGYGLDYAEDYRALPDIYVIESGDRRNAH